MKKDQLNGELPLIGGVLRQPAPIEDGVIAGFGDEEESAISRAVTYAWLQRRVQRMSLNTAVALTGITPQHFALIVRGRKYLPPQKLNAYEDVVGNTAVSQTIARFRRLRDAQVQRELGELVAERLLRRA